MTLRVRLTTYYTVFFSIALLILGVGLYLLVRQLLLESIADELRVGSSLVQDAYAANSLVISGTNEIDVFELQPPDLSNIESPELYVQVSQLDGKPLARTGNLGSDSLPLPPEVLSAARSGREIQTTERIGNVRVLLLVVPLRIGPSIAGVTQVAQSLRQSDRALTALLWALIGGGVLSVLAAARGSLWLARAALQPIDEVSSTAARILSADDLHQRVPEVDTADEVGRLTRTVNEMLRRIDRLFSVQQRFTADVAHELRTPLAAIRGNLEIIRRSAQQHPEILDESLRDVEREVLRLSRMANDLLVLAQADAGVALRTAPVQLDELLIEVYRELRPIADARLRIDLDDEIALTADRDRIKQALINLVANALQHTPPDGHVTLGLRRDHDRALIRVADSGPGIAPELLPTLFDRFVRGDRSRSGGGAGLGLSIVKWVAEAHGGDIAVESQPGVGTTFTLAVPIQPSLAPGAAR